MEGKSMEVGDLYDLEEFLEAGFDDDDLLSLVPLKNGGPQILLVLMLRQLPSKPIQGGCRMAPLSQLCCHWPPGRHFNDWRQ